MQLASPVRVRCGDQNKAMNIITGLFRDRDSAERAYQSIVERGYDTSDINLV